MLDPPVAPAWEISSAFVSWILVAPAEGQVLYRVVGRSVPRPRDFESNRDKDRPRWPDQTYVDYLGISMFETEELAKESAIRWPKLIARVPLEEGRGFSLARTEADLEGHYAVWGDPQALLDSVVGAVSRHDAPG